MTAAARDETTGYFFDVHVLDNQKLTDSEKAELARLVGDADESHGPVLVRKA